MLINNIKLILVKLSYNQLKFSLSIKKIALYMESYNLRFNGVKFSLKQNSKNCLRRNRLFRFLIQNKISQKLFLQ